MDVVFFGTPQFAVPSLQALLNSNDFKVTGVFTQPDRRAGRGKKFCCPPVKLLAAEYGVEIFQPERIRGNSEALGIMESLRPDIAVVVAFGQILPEDFFTVPRLDTVNVHASILPAYRGASPIVRAVMNGEKVTGVSIMKIDRGMDTGDVLSTKKIAIPPDATAGYMEMVLASEGARLLTETVTGYSEGRIVPVKQDHEKATYAPKISGEDCLVNWEMPAYFIYNQVRALNPRPGARTSFRKEGADLKIWKAGLAEGISGDMIMPGTIFSTSGGKVRVACGDATALELLEVQLSGRARISAPDFLNGCGITAGDKLGEAALS